jgi:hypothetical protein
MSEEQTTEEPQHYIAPIPYAVFDALFHFHTLHLQGGGLRVVRTQHTTGSCVYGIAPKGSNKAYGHIWLRSSIIPNHTVCTILPGNNETISETDKLESIRLILATTWYRMKEEMENDRDLTSIDELTFNDEMVLQQYIKEHGFTIARRSSAKPTASDSIDTWLDYREHERKRGNRLTLEYIAEQSGKSLGTLKKYSAMRQKPAPKE